MFDAYTNFNLKFKNLEQSNFISLYRNSLMGIAILWIVLLHTEITFGRMGLLSDLLLFVKQTGHIGVDIFFFVSGFGLMAGWYKKRPTILHFYKRRFLRIMPIYWLFLIINLILLALSGKHWNYGSIIVDFTGFGFFIGTGGNWFISAILLCYLIFPFFANHFQTKKNKIRFLILNVGLFLVFAIILTIAAFLYCDKFSYLLISILRLPAFFIGILIGYVFIKKDDSFNYLFSIHIHIFFTLICFITFAFVFYLSSIEDRWLYGLYWYPFVLGSFSLTFLLSILLDILHKRFNHSLIILDEIGRSSLELYFTHFLVFSYIIKIRFIFNSFGILLNGNYLWIVGIFISVVFSIIINRIFQRIGISKIQTFNIDK